MTNHKSEVAQFRERQALEEQASRLGLYGPAIVADHKSITKRLQQGADCILQLVEQGKLDEALQMMEQPDWGAGRQEMRSALQSMQQENYAE